MKKLSYLFVSLVALAGCGNAAETGSSSTASQEKTNTSTSETHTSTNSPQESITGKEITVYSAGPEGLSEKIKVAFEEKTGAKVNLFQGTTGKILAKMEAEKSKPIADVVVLASLSSMDGLKEQGVLQDYPDAKGFEQLNPEWSDKDHYYFGYSASALGIVYNTKTVTTPPTEWTDLAKITWKDQVNIPDPTLSGSALDFLYGFTTETSGWDTIKDWSTNGLQIMGANKAALDAVITGEKEVTLSGVDYMAYKAKADGEPVEIVYPKSGTVVSPRAAAITKTTKELATSQAFIDYLLSDEGQELVTDAYILPGNSAIPVKNRAALNEIHQLKVDWTGSEKKQAEVLDKFATIVNP